MKATTSEHFQTFKRGSKTYFYSSIFFPEPLRSNVFRLYGFVRKADDFVDNIPQDREGFHAFKQAYHDAMQGRKSNDVIIDSFVDLSHELDFEPAWTEAFLGAMEADLDKSTYHSIEETKTYMYGSAEVIGLYMSRIMSLDPESYPHAQSLGRAMQYINFIRDVNEDQELGRTYLPLVDTELTSLSEKEARNKTEAFTLFMRREINRFREWQKHGEEGYRFIPRRYLIPIKTAMDMYLWTARQIEKNPLVVYRKQMKPRAGRIVMAITKNSLTLPKSNNL